MVHGTHTYAVDSYDQTGGVYNVTVTISTAYSNTLTLTQGVHVERPPVTGFADNVVAQPGAAITNVEVAAFTEPDLSDSAGEFAATINWGDGSSSSGTVTESGGVFYVLGSHTYSTVGDYPILVAVSQNWDTSVTTLYLLGLAAIPAAAASIEGPHFVPGNSRYNFEFTLPAGIKAGDLKSRSWSSSNPIASEDSYKDSNGEGYRKSPDNFVTITIPLKVDAFVPILWGVMPVFTFAGREASHAPGENL